MGAAAGRAVSAGSARRAASSTGSAPSAGTRGPALTGGVVRGGRRRVGGADGWRVNDEGAAQALFEVIV